MSVDLTIGDIGIRIISDSAGPDIALPPAYNEFYSPPDSSPPAGTLHIVYRADESTESSRGRVVSTGFNDLGETLLFFNGQVYTVGISPRPGVPMRYMILSEDFREGHLFLASDESWNPFILDSMLRIFFSQIAVMESAFLVHASAIKGSRGAHLFMGKSGTGKSTHSSLWLNTFDGYTLLNDDNPLVRLLSDGSVRAYGTPWSGKTKCWLNSSAPLLSMTRLYQAPVNRYSSQTETLAFVATLPGVSVISHSKMLYDRACHTLSLVTEKIRVGLLDCLPDTEAAHVCRNHIEQLEN